MYKYSLTSKTSESGFTLIELMISLTLGLVVMLGASQIFVSVNQAYSETQRFAQLQGELSLVSDMLAADVRAATAVVLVDDNGNSTLTLTQAGGDVVYALVRGTLNRTSGVVTEGISEQVASFSAVCVDAAADLSTACTSPVMLRLAVGISSSDGSNARRHLVEFNVALRNNVLATKFAG
jgi:prepilin-type N-terminal cleavage/methylation domain-containing protein